MNYEEIVCDANNLYRAYKVSVKTSKWKETTQKFMMNFLRYIFSSQDDLMNRTLQNGPTQEFTLFERGRVRPITCLLYTSRCVYETVSAFMTNVQPFIEGATQLNPSMLDGVKALAETILILTLSLIHI